MANDPFYKSPVWRRLCAAVARRSRGLCEAPGCQAKAIVVDHIRGRRKGGTDTLDNLRHLCRRHDNAAKENAKGERARGGVLIGCDAHGVPLDPNHPWHTPSGSITGALGDSDRGGTTEQS